jgi:membrane protease YdiL (CAAX protease family)
MSASLSLFRQTFIRMSPGAKLLLLVFLVMFFFLVGSLLSILLGMAIYHVNTATLYQILANPNIENIGILRFFQILQSVSIFIIPACIAAWLFSERSFDYIRVNSKSSAITLTLVLLSLSAALPAMNAITGLNARLDLPVWLEGIEKSMINMEDKATHLTELFLTSGTYSDLLINFLMIAILPALGEEFIFRGLLQRLLIEITKNRHAGVIIAAFVFSFIHLQFFGFIPRFLLGLYFGYLMLWSGSIWVPVVAHLINNGMAVIAYHFADRTVGKTTMDTIGTNADSNYVLYLSVFVTSVLIGMIYLHEKPRRGKLDGSDFL